VRNAVISAASRSAWAMVFTYSWRRDLGKSLLSLPYVGLIADHGRREGVVDHHQLDEPDLVSCEARCAPSPKSRTLRRRKMPDADAVCGSTRWRKKVSRNGWSRVRKAEETTAQDSRNLSDARCRSAVTGWPAGYAPAATGATKTRTAEVEAVATEMARPAFKRDGVGHIFPFFSATAGRGDGNKPEKSRRA
jgi:hypothetical protein